MVVRGLRINDVEGRVELMQYPLSTTYGSEQSERSFNADVVVVVGWQVETLGFDGYSFTIDQLRSAE